jgi:hypothetical protein
MDGPQSRSGHATLVRKVNMEGYYMQLDVRNTIVQGRSDFIQNTENLFLRNKESVTDSWSCIAKYHIT